MMVDPSRRMSDVIFAPVRRPYRICVRCIMDISDPEIEFDAGGVCSHCHAFDRAVQTFVVSDEPGRNRLAAVLAQIKAEGRGKRYDCVIGLSGGVDSSYVAFLAKKLGLRPLAVHLDNGWNSEVAVRNIEHLVKVLDLDLYTVVLDWEQFRQLQIAFLRGSTPDSEIPTDHAIVATMYQVAMRYGVRWLVEGSNVATESMVPATWSHGHSDWGYIRHLNDTFGGAPLTTYPHYTAFDYRFRFPMILKLQRCPILNYVEYSKREAEAVLAKEVGWVPYGGKHYESIYTRFYQGYILPVKFGFDKRRPHFSCLVNNGELTREQALEEMAKPAIPSDQLAEDRAFVLKKLGLSEQEFESIMALPRKTFWDYPSNERHLPDWWVWKLYCFALRLIGVGKTAFRLARYLWRGEVKQALDAVARGWRRWQGADDRAGTS